MAIVYCNIVQPVFTECQLIRLACGRQGLLVCPGFYLYELLHLLQDYRLQKLRLISKYLMLMCIVKVLASATTLIDQALNNSIPPNDLYPLSTQYVTLTTELIRLE